MFTLDGIIYVFIKKKLRRCGVAAVGSLRRVDADGEVTGLDIICILLANILNKKNSEFLLRYTQFVETMKRARNLLDF